MFKRLRNRFLIMHMATVSVLILVFFGMIFLFVYSAQERNSNDVLMRANTRFAFEHGRMENLPVFIVDVDSNNNIVAVMSNFSNIQNDIYKSATEQALAKKAAVGKIKYEDTLLKYRITANRIVFVDITREVDMLQSLARIFFWIAIPLLLIIFFISRYFANRAIKPIENAFAKQKEFIADASHELKTPLATISTNADVLLGTADTEQKKWLGHIKAEVERMANLTGSLLYLAKMDYDNTMNVETLNLGEVLEDILLPLEAVLYEKDIDITLDIAPNVTISGDKSQIHRLFGILIDNAIKYADGQIKISIEKAQSHAKITVKNSGSAIPKDDLEKIWDRFYRADEAREYTGGFGLGLSIAKAIVKAHGGKIKCESNSDLGTRFIVQI